MIWQIFNLIFCIEHNAYIRYFIFYTQLLINLNSSEPKFFDLNHFDFELIRIY